MRLVTLARQHRAMTAVLVLGVLLRAMSLVAYWPGLFFSDSWSYLYSAWSDPLVRVEWDRPAGYAFAVKVLGGGQHVVAPIVVLQHLAGLATGVLLYAFLIGRRIPRLPSALVAAAVILDANLIAVEQHVLPEAFFSLLLLASLLLAVTRAGDWRAIALSGLLLAAAILLRTQAVFVAVPWFIFLVGMRVGWRPLAGALATLLVPLALYAGVMHAKWDRTSITAANGFFLYGRVAEIADCDGLDVTGRELELCRQTVAAQDDQRGPGYFLWVPSSPVRRLYPALGTEPRAHNAADAEIGQLARAVIRHDPGRYARLAATDFLRFFAPGEESRGTSDTAILLPRRPLDRAPDLSVALRDRLLPGYRPAARWPAGALHDYQRAVSTPRATLALLLLAALAALLVAWRRPERRGHAAAIFLLAGSATAMLAGAALTSGFIVRYLLPAVPLFLGAGVLAIATLWPGRSRAIGD